MLDPHPKAPTHRRRKQARPQELLDAALELFVERGFAATRMEEIATLAGVSKGTLYLYYASKEDLLKAVIRERLSGEIEIGAAAVAGHVGSCAELLRQLVEQWWLRLYDSPASGVFKLIIPEVRSFPDIAAYYRANGVPQPYEGTARRKIVPAELERRILDAFPPGTVPLFRKTSCAVSSAHAMPDYNGHVGIRELCDICPAAQLARCLTARRLPTVEEVGRVASRLPESDDLEVVDIDDRRMLVNGLDEQPRYYLQHTLGYQVHDSRHPHRPGRHGRAEIGWSEGDPR